MSVMEGMLVRGTRIVIPKKLQPEVISLSHESHGLGETKTVQLLRESTWFPRMTRLVKEFVSSCTECAAAVPGNVPAPIISQLMPEKPWQKVAVDFKGPIGGTKGYYFRGIYYFLKLICFPNTFYGGVNIFPKVFSTGVHPTPPKNQLLIRFEPLQKQNFLFYKNVFF